MREKIIFSSPNSQIFSCDSKILLVFVIFLEIASAFPGNPWKSIFFYVINFRYVSEEVANILEQDPTAVPMTLANVFHHLCMEYSDEKLLQTKLAEHLRPMQSELKNEEITEEDGESFVLFESDRVNE